jgi:uncharacterized protein involved in exopolysaccharide biosynthesis
MYRQTNIQYRLIESLFRFKGRFFAVLLSALLITAYLLYTKSKMYMCSVSVRVPTNSAFGKVISEATSSEYSSYMPPAKLHSGRFMDLLNDNKEKGFMDEAIKRAGMRELINPLPSAESKEYEKFVLNTTTTEDSGEVFSIVVRWPNKEGAEKLVSGLREQYIEWAGNTRVESTKQALGLVNKKHTEESEKLRKMDAGLDAFGKTNSQRMPGLLENDQALISRYYMELGEKEAELKTTITSRQELEKRMPTLPEFIVDAKTETADASSVVTDGDPAKSGGSTYALLNAVKRQKNNKLRNRYLANSSVIQDLDRQISELEKQIEGEKQDTLAVPTERLSRSRNPALSSAEIQIPYLKIDEKNIRLEIADKKRQILEIGSKLKGYEGVRAKHETLKNAKEAEQKVVAALSEKMKSLELQIKTDKEMATKQFENIGTVYATKSVNQRNLGLLLMGGTILGVIFGCIAVLMSEISDPSLRYGEDVENGLQLPVLSVVPESRSLQGTELSPEFRWFKLDDLGK